MLRRAGFALLAVLMGWVMPHHALMAHDPGSLRAYMVMAAQMQPASDHSTHGDLGDVPDEAHCGVACGMTALPCEHGGNVLLPVMRRVAFTAHTPPLLRSFAISPDPFPPRSLSLRHRV